MKNIFHLWKLEVVASFVKNKNSTDKNTVLHIIVFAEIILMGIATPSHGKKSPWDSQYLFIPCGVWCVSLDYTGV